jgi:hypothetical protein
MTKHYETERSRTKRGRANGAKPRKPIEIQGCQIFLDATYQNRKNISNDHKIYQMATNYAKWPQNRTNGHKTYQQLPLQGPSKFTQIGIFWFENIPSGNPVEI